MPQSHTIQPPRLWSHLIALIAPPEESEPLLGDLSEEFAAIASVSGVETAQRWYRRQAIHSALQLLGSGAVVAAAAAGYAALIAANHIVDTATTLLLEKFPVYPYAGPRTVWWIRAVTLQSVMIPIFAGWTAATLARKRAVTAAVALSTFTALTPLLAMASTLAQAEQIRRYLPHANPILFALSAWELAWLPPLSVLLGASLRRHLRSHKHPRAA